MTSVKEKARNIFDAVLKIFSKDYFIYIYSAITLLSFFFGLDIIGLTLAVLLFSFICFTKADLKAAGAILVLLAFNMSIEQSPINNPSNYTEKIPYFAVLIAILLSSVIYAIVKRKLYVKVSYVLYSLLAMGVSLLMGGFLSLDYTLYNLLVAAVLVIYFMVLFCFFSMIIKEKDFTYVAKLIISMAVVICIQMAYLYIIDDVLRDTFDKSLVILGWGANNSIALYLLIALPFCIYYMAKSKYSLLFYFILLVINVMIFLTFARTTLIMSVPVSVAGVVYSIIVTHGKKRLGLFIVTLLIAVLGIAILVMQWDKFVEVANFYIKTGLSDRGRKGLYQEAIEQFGKYPIFGMGAYYKFGEWDLLLYLVHNNVLQSMLWAGVLGLITYVAFIVAVIYSILINANTKKVIVGIAFMLIMANSMLDMVMYFPPMSFIMMLFLAYIDNCNGKKRLKTKLQDKEDMQLDNESIESKNQNITNGKIKIIK